MNFQQIAIILQDLPSTFKRNANPYLNFQDSVTAALVRGGGAVDEVGNSSAQIQNAQFGQLDIWGLLFGVPRLTNEADAHYLTRIIFQTTSGNGTPVAIALWIYIVYGVVATVNENFPTIGYSLVFPSSLTTAQITQIINSLSDVRPAGVPFTIQASSGGPYLTTINFLAAARTTGAFIAGVESGTVVLAPNTNNAQPLLPDIFLTDPILNP